MGPMIKEDFPDVKNMTRFSYTDVIFKQGDNVFRESLSAVDDSFYEMLGFPIKWGSKKQIPSQNEIVLTLTLSEKLFGKGNSTGKRVDIIFDNNGQK